MGSRGYQKIIGDPAEGPRQAAHRKGDVDSRASQRASLQHLAFTQRMWKYIAPVMFVSFQRARRTVLTPTLSESCR